MKMEHDMVEWLNATLERIAVALERVADRMDKDRADHDRAEEERIVTEERIAAAEARRQPFGRTL
jgi:hypothetical protein